MSKRTIIIFTIAILAIIAGAASMYFDNKKTVDEANDIINGEQPEVKPKAEKKAKPVINEVTPPDNGTGNSAE